MALKTILVHIPCVRITRTCSKMLVHGSTRWSPSLLERLRENLVDFNEKLFKILYQNRLDGQITGPGTKFLEFLKCFSQNRPRFPATALSKVNLFHAVNCMALCGANLVTLRSKVRPNETRTLHCAVSNQTLHQRSNGADHGSSERGRNKKNAHHFQPSIGHATQIEERLFLVKKVPRSIVEMSPVCS